MSYIVTNRHVIENNEDGKHFKARRAYVTFTLFKEDGSPDYGNKTRLELTNFESRWFGHPNPEIDLAIISVDDILNSQAKSGRPFAAIGLDQSLIPDDAGMKSLSTIEDILVIGYPIGIYDESNNVPVVRRGITATPPFLNFDGRPIFLIDAPIYHGSSGSPVLLFHRGAWVDEKTSQVSLGINIKLLGVVFAVFNEKEHTNAPKKILRPITVRSSQCRPILAMI